MGDHYSCRNKCSKWKMDEWCYRLCNRRNTPTKWKPNDSWLRGKLGNHYTNWDKCCQWNVGKWYRDNKISNMPSKWGCIFDRR